MLPDDALLEIFDFYMVGERDAWSTLVHVCQKWRNVVFESPRRLHLQLYCQAMTPVREMLDIWPPLPMFVSNGDLKKWGMDNVLAALEHNDCIGQLKLFLSSSDVSSSKLLAAIQQPFPALRRLALLYVGFPESTVIPTSFLGGAAPDLEHLMLKNIPLPGLPNLLLSATHLVYLHLDQIPDSGYFTPEAMVTCLSVMTRLKKLFSDFENFRTHRNLNQHPHPQTRALLPALTRLSFSGVSDYLEDLVARIDAPLLNKLTIKVIPRQLFDTETSQLTQFICRTPKFKAYGEARDSLYREEHLGFIYVNI
jgi:hypothetical protein